MSATAGGWEDLTVVVTCTVAASDGGTSSSRRPVSLLSAERTRTMQSTGRDGSDRVTLIVIDAVCSSITRYPASVPLTSLVPKRW